MVGLGVCEGMNGFFLLLPFILIRFTLLSKLNQGAMSRAAFFPARQGKEVLAYWIYQLSNVAIVIGLSFLTCQFSNSWSCYIAMIMTGVVLILCAITIINFATTQPNGMNENGIYRFSRNPMYVSYFVYFMGCALLTQSVLLCGIVLVFQISSHWIILSEERWCIQKFGDEYVHYMSRVRRYI